MQIGTGGDPGLCMASRFEFCNTFQLQRSYSDSAAVLPWPWVIGPDLIELVCFLHLIFVCTKPIIHDDPTLLRGAPVIRERGTAAVHTPTGSARCTVRSVTEESAVCYRRVRIHSIHSSVRHVATEESAVDPDRSGSIADCAARARGSHAAAGEIEPEILRRGELTELEFDQT